METKGKEKRNIMTVIVAVVFIVIILALCVITSQIEKHRPSNRLADLNEYFGFEGDLSGQGALGMKKSDEVALIIDDQILEEKGVLIENEIYVPEDVIQKYLNKRFYWDANENLLTYTTPTDIIRVEVGSKEYSVGKNKQSVEYQIVKTDGSKACYIALDFVTMYTAVEGSFYDGEPRRAQLTTKWGERELTSAGKETAAVRLQANIKSDILTQIDASQKVEVLDKEGDWYKVLAPGGYIGYMQKKQAADLSTDVSSSEFVAPEYTSIKKDYKINMAWHQVTNENGNKQLSSVIENVKGVNTISPTWFSLSDNEGNFTSLASSSYVSLAHRCGMEVWALIDNFSGEVSSKEVLSYTSKRERLINQLVAAAVEYDLDGLNIDFESIPEEAGEDFIQFIRELSTKCRVNGIVLSIDNYVPGYTDYYDREEQGIVADYVIIMGYDEHSGASEESGSVASLPYVKEGIESTLAQAPAEKVINGIPFYSRLWKETPKTEEELAAEDVNSEYRPYHLSSEAVGMTTMDKIVAQSGAELIWDDTAKQNYLEYAADGVTYKMWLEDAASIEEKLKLMSSYQLAGVAEWKLGLEKSEIWDVIVKYTN